MIKKVIAIATIFLFVAMFFIMIWVFIDSHTEETIDKPAFTIGTYSYYRYERGYTAYIEYIVDGKQYYSATPHRKSMVIGEKFKVKYEKDNPGKHILLLHEPVFENYETTEHTTGNITSIVRIGKNHVFFEYTAQNDKYRRSQFYDSERYSPSRNEKYKIEYWVENPQRSIINLDERLN